jgi:hypothetical protein
VFRQEMNISPLREEKCNLQEFFRLFGVLAIGLDAFLQPVHPFEKYRLQSRFFDAVKNPSNCFKKLLYIRERATARPPLTYSKERSQMERYQVNIEDAAQFSSNYLQKIQLRILRCAARHYPRALPTFDRVPGHQMHTFGQRREFLGDRMHGIELTPFSRTLIKRELREI